MGTVLPIEQAERFFPMATLTPDGDALTLHEEVSGETTEGFVDHTIELATGRYSATTMLTDHAIGEQHVIVAEGSCELGSASAKSANLGAGRELFLSTGCGQCHALADAGTTGGGAPSLDANPHLSKALVMERLTHGQGDMPAFVNLLTDEQMDIVASYVVAVARP